MRTQAEIDECEAIAARINFEEPPEHLQPHGQMLVDRTWSELVDWFDGRDIPWPDAIHVYISRRWDRSIPHVYAMIDTWKKFELDRIDKRDNPDDFIGGYN